VFGAAGYAGALSARLIDRHPQLELRAITARGAGVGRRLSDIYPHHRVALELEELDLDRHAEVEAAIVAYPHGAAAEQVSELLARGVQVVDLSADFRLRDPAVYEEWYREHPHPELIGEAVYGLPELYREQLRGARLVANPGCYPTAAILSLAPLARAGLIADVVIDAKSGVSGAGRGATEKTHFVTVDENLSLRRPAPPAHAGDRAGVELARVRPLPDVHPAPDSARPGGACLVLRDSYPRGGDLNLH
jgi:N-acetyl-gamma-glutamyl-phosphate reductase